MKLKNIKVVMIGQKDFPSRDGGIETVLTELCPRLEKSGAEVTVINRYSKRKNKRKEYKNVNIKYAITISWKGLSAVTSSFFATLRAICGNYNIVHFHAEGPSAMIVIPKIFGKKTVATVHGLDWKREKWSGLASKYIKFGEKMIAKYADKIIVLNLDTKKYFEDKYNVKSEYIPNGVEIRKRIDLNEGNNDFNLVKDDYFLTVSRITEEKGLHKLIKSFYNVDTNKKLVIVGSGSDIEYKKKLEKLAEEDERVLFTGFLSGEKLEAIYSNAFLFIIPSSIEGMPMAMLEAMSYGNAVAGSNIPEISEIIDEKHGRTFNPNDEFDICRAINFFLNNEQDRINIGSANKELMQYEYGWEKVTERTMLLYDDLLR